MSKHTETAGQYPVIPLRTEVQLPGHVGPLEIGRCGDHRLDQSQRSLPRSVSLAIGIAVLDPDTLRLLKRRPLRSFRSL